MSEIRKRRFNLLDFNEDFFDNEEKKAFKTKENPELEIVNTNHPETSIPEEEISDQEHPVRHLNPDFDNFNEREYQEKKDGQEGKDEEDEKERDDDDEDADNQKLIFYMGNGKFKFTPLINPKIYFLFRSSYESLQEQAKIREGYRCLIRTSGKSKAYTSFSIHEVLEFLEQNFFSVSHLSQSVLDNVYETSYNSPSSIVRIIRNLLEEGPFLRSNRLLCNGSYMKARELTDHYGDLKLETIRRHLLVFKKRSKSGGESGGKMYCILNADEDLYGVHIENRGRIMESRNFIHMFTSSQLLAFASSNKYYFHDFFMCLLQNQVSFSFLL
jgi:hypothetical protein